jgi:hypothetical protein
MAVNQQGLVLHNSAAANADDNMSTARIDANKLTARAVPTSHGARACKNIAPAVCRQQLPGRKYRRRSLMPWALE